MRIIAFVFTVAMFAFGASAQTAKEVLAKAKTALQNAGGIEASLHIETLNGQQPSTTQGQIRLKGEKFVLDTPESATWFDGKTQWTYLNDNNEVNITNPTTEEIESINPYALLSLHERGYTYTLGAQTTYKGKAVYEVRLSSPNTRSDILKLTVLLDKSSYYPVYIEGDFQNDVHSRISVSEFKQGVQFNDAFFVFDKNKYPQVEIIDLR